MLSYLKGRVLYKDKGSVVLVIRDIGYRVFVNDKLFVKLEEGQEVELFTYQYVREDSLNLYGFENREQLTLFELMLSISGIGPKSALSATSIADAGEFREYVSRGDASLLTQVSGIGKKTAERIVVELRDKIGGLPPAVSGGSSESGSESGFVTQDELDALIALGYSLTQAREALKQVDPGIKDSGQRIREALRNIK